MLDFVFILLSAFVVVVVTARVTDRRHELRRDRPSTRRVRRISSKHQGQAGVIVEIFWPVGMRGGMAASVARVSCRESHATRFTRTPDSRRRPFWVPLSPGAHELHIEAEGARPQTDELEVRLREGEHVLLLCWPSKRKFVTRARANTVWEMHRLPSV
jgi:hypothetical protein